MRGRMPAVVSLVVFLLVAGVFVWPEVAKADPHAVFYTAIGQRQLFLNVLAALNQADYVEPALGNFSRSELEQRRDAALRAEAEAAGQTADLTQDPVSAATETDLSGLVVRPITLEGNDLFTQMQAKDRAVEAKRQAGLADLLTRGFCRALGRKNCSDSISALAQRDQAYITNPLKWQVAPYINGFVATLFSGTDEHANRAKEIKKSDQFEPGFLSNSAIVSLREGVSQEAGDQITDATIRTALSALPLSPHPNTFNDITVDANGNAKLAFEPPQRSLTNSALAQETSDEYVGRYREKMRQQLYFAQALQSAAQQGAATIKSFQDTIEEDGEKADVELATKSDPIKKCTPTGCKIDPPEDAKDKSLLPAIVVPVAGRLAQVDALAQGLADANTGLHDASVQALEDPVGTVPLTEGEGASEVQGITTGTVAGTISNGDTKFDSVARAVNERFPHAGQELGHVVAAFSPDRYPGTRCGCKLDNTANVFGAQIITAINKYSL